MCKILLIWILGAFTIGGLNAQGTPYFWSFTAKKVTDRTYEIHCKVSVNPPWHTYSQFTPEGGPLPTKLEFTKNPLYHLAGPAKEVGNMVAKHEAVFNVDVKYFDGEVDFVQSVKMKGSARTNLSGSVTFMFCNNEQCLPPTTQKFSLVIN